MLGRIFLSLLVLSVPLLGYEYTYKTEKIDDSTQRVSISFSLAPDEYLYKESFLPSVNTKDVTLSPVKVEGQATTFFDKTFKTNKEGYKDTVSFIFEAHKEPTKEVKDAVIHTHFSVSSTPQPQEKVITLSFQPSLEQTGIVSAQAPEEQKTSVSATYTPKHDIPCDIPQPSLWGNLVQRGLNSISATVGKWKHTLSSLFTSTGSQGIRLIVALILGILLSLTPCIYPMIPITVGILQANSSKSALRNFTLAFSYTLGISLTFALLGLIAAFGSCVFGELQGSPFVVIPLAALLLYFGGSMFGFYEMYIPRFLQPKTTSVKGGSHVSAFIFGAISGSVASPCLSPGLTLILHYVGHISTTGSLTAYIESFILLFVFGIGSSLPLLIIGTFSSSLNMLPRAGMWMVEVKKIFGIMLTGMALYHLSNLEKYFPWYIFVWVIVASLAALGIYYFMNVTTYDTKWTRRYKNFMGTALIIAACLMAAQGYKAFYEHFYPTSIWTHDYKAGRERAQKEGKRLFIDIGATHCGACKSLDRSIFHNDRILQTLALYVPIKIQSDVHTTAFEDIKKPFDKIIQGFPTFLIIDPTNEQLIKKWDIDIEDLGIEGLVQALEQYSK